MTRYMIPRKLFSLSTFPGAFIIIFMFLVLPFFLAGELGWQGFREHVAVIMACAALLSLVGSLWISRWVEKRQAEESLEVDDEGVTSTMRPRLPPKAANPRGGATEQQGTEPLAKVREATEKRVLWENVRAVELRSHRWSRSLGTHYQISLITADDVLSLPLNDEALGTRQVVEVDSEGHPLAQSREGRYSGYGLVQEIYRHVSEVPWRVKKTFAGKYREKEEEIAFSGIEDPWSGDTVSTSTPSGVMPRKWILIAILLAILTAILVSGFLIYSRANARKEAAKAEAIRRERANQELKTTREQAP